MLQRPISNHWYGGTSYWCSESTNQSDYYEAVSPWENILGALVLVQTLPPKFAPWSKYYAINKIWFCEEIHNCGIQLLNIDTVEQLGDIST